MTDLSPNINTYIFACIYNNTHIHIHAYVYMQSTCTYMHILMYACTTHAHA